jgi:hypothetical protein
MCDVWCYSCYYYAVHWAEVHCIVYDCAVLYLTNSLLWFRVSYCSVVYRILLYWKELNYIILYCIMLDFIAFVFTVLKCFAALYCTVQYCIVLYCIVSLFKKSIV